MYNKIFSSLSFVAVLDPGWIKIRIRDKHPSNTVFTFSRHDGLDIVPETESYVLLLL
jgi:hypothetical protein